MVSGGQVRPIPPATGSASAPPPPASPPPSTPAVTKEAFVTDIVGANASADAKDTAGMFYDRFVRDNRNPSDAMSRYLLPSYQYNATDSIINNNTPDTADDITPARFVAMRSAYNAKNGAPPPAVPAGDKPPEPPATFKLPERHLELGIYPLGFGVAPGGNIDGEAGVAGSSASSSNNCSRTGFGPCSSDNGRPYSRVSYVYAANLSATYIGSTNDKHTFTAGLDVPIYYIKMTNDANPQWGTNAIPPSDIMSIGAFLMGGYRYNDPSGAYVGGSLGIGVQHQFLLGDKIKTTMDSDVDASKYNFTAIPVIGVRLPFGFRFSDHVGASAKVSYDVIPSQQSMKRVDAANTGGSEHFRGIQHTLTIDLGLSFYMF